MTLATPSDAVTKLGQIRKTATLIEKHSGRQHDKVSGEPQVNSFRLARCNEN